MIQALKVAWWFNVLVEPAYDMLQDNQSRQRKVSQTEATYEYCDGNAFWWSVKRILPLARYHYQWLYSCKFTLDTLHSTTMNWWQRSGTIRSVAFTVRICKHLHKWKPFTDYSPLVSGLICHHVNLKIITVSKLGRITLRVRYLEVYVPDYLM